MSLLALKLLAVEGALVGVFASAFTANYSNELQAAGIVIAALVVVVAGVFTIKSHIASDWHQEAEAQHARADRLQEEMNAATVEQQRLRHDLKEELATARAEILLLQAKTDLSAHEELAQKRNGALLTALTTIQERLDLGTAVMQKILAHLERTSSG